MTHILSLTTSETDGLYVPTLSSFIYLIIHEYPSWKRHFWKLNIPGDGINLWYWNPPLFYAVPVLACTDEFFCNLETTRVETRSLRPTRVHETWKHKVCNKRKSIMQETSQSEISESYFCAPSNVGNSSMTSPSLISSAPPPKLQRKRKS